MGSPYADKPVGRGFLLGLPFDTGTHAFRVGARQGPTHVRACSSLIRRFHTEFDDADPLSLLEFVDCGDVDVTPSLIAPAFERIEAELSALRFVVPTTIFASCARSAEERTVAVISSTAAAVSSSEDACSLAPAARDSEPPASWPAMRSTSRERSRRSPIIRSSAALIRITETTDMTPPVTKPRMATRDTTHQARV